VFSEAVGGVQGALAENFAPLSRLAGRGCGG